MIGIAIVPAPWGPIHLAADETAVVGLEVLTSEAAFIDALRRRLGETPVPSAGAETLPAAVRRRLDEAGRAVTAHLAGTPDALAALPLDLRGRTAWDGRVLAGVREIHWGEVMGYGALARVIGSPGAARAVGGAVGRNPIGLLIPCHRVIAGDGTLGGYGGGWGGERETLLGIKATLLEIEGRWIPARGDAGPTRSDRPRTAGTPRVSPG